MEYSDVCSQQSTQKFDSHRRDNTPMNEKLSAVDRLMIENNELYSGTLPGENQETVKSYRLNTTQNE